MSWFAFDFASVENDLGSSIFDSSWLRSISSVKALILTKQKNSITQIRNHERRLKSEGRPIQVFSILVFCLRWVDEFSPFCFFLLSLAWLGLGNHELERWNRGTWKSLCAARGVIFCKGSIWMLIFVAFCYLCCLPSISVDASLAPKNLQSFTRKKREDETSHRREENSVGERKKTNKQCPFTRSRQITFGRHRCRDCQSCSCYYNSTWSKSLE